MGVNYSWAIKLHLPLSAGWEMEGWISLYSRSGGTLEHCWVFSWVTITRNGGFDLKEDKCHSYGNSIKLKVRNMTHERRLFNTYRCKRPEALWNLSCDALRPAQSRLLCARAVLSVHWWRVLSAITETMHISVSTTRANIFTRDPWSYTGSTLRHTDSLCRCVCNWHTNWSAMCW